MKIVIKFIGASSSKSETESQSIGKVITWIFLFAKYNYDWMAMVLLISLLILHHFVIIIFNSQQLEDRL